MSKPLILVTNDDGVESPGLLAAVRALRGLGELMVVAPLEQQSSKGRSFAWKQRPVVKSTLRLANTNVTTIAVDASPAVCVRYALMLGVPRPPALVVSGINYGENLGNGLTISGTVGAALEAAADGVPALAVSLETAKEYHLSHSTLIDFSIAAMWTRKLAKQILLHHIAREIPVINVNVPSDATRETKWRVTRASQQAYFRSLVEAGKFIGYDVMINHDNLERDSDIYAVSVERIVSVSPLTFDLTARESLKSFAKTLKALADD
ncbi:MAG: 5'/3'-nucleotidase SurE [Chloroflexi bacterium]|nr:5'/3'-nucleotidase SurE [Chloroflexota bacterium]